MTETFRRYVIFAEMRTGSNLLEATLNRIKRVTCFGEAFNPYMMGWPDKDELKGVTMAQRDADPMQLLNALWDKPDHLPGFRYFHNHDPRIFDAIIDDRECAKIVLTRNPLDSYVSTRLAYETNQWKLNESETPTPAAIRFDGADFRRMLSAVGTFQQRVLHRLQASGQAAFWLGYDDLRDADVMTGLLHWLGRTDLDRVDPANDQVPQNPRAMTEKVVNYDEMQAELQRFDPFATQRIPSFEPSRGPAVPSFIGADAGRGLLFMPVRGGPTDAVANWLHALARTEGDFTQNTLRQWKRARPGHRGFTVLRHPLYRAWQAFQALLTAAKPDLRQLMRDVYRVPLPVDEALPKLSDGTTASLFADFLGFLRRNLNGQTTLPTHPGWASQTEILAGFARFATPDAVLREDRLHTDLPWLTGTVGLSDPGILPEPARYPDFLHDRALIDAARAAYQRDYVTFGFDDPA